MQLSRGSWSGWNVVGLFGWRGELDKERELVQWDSEVLTTAATVPGCVSRPVPAVQVGFAQVCSPGNVCMPGGFSTAVPVANHTLFRWRHSHVCILKTRGLHLVLGTVKNFRCAISDQENLFF